jgi:hypothetical protein
MSAVIKDVCGSMRKTTRWDKGALTICEGPRNDTVSPRSREEGMGQSREWIRQHSEQDGRHHQPQPSQKSDLIEAKILNHCSRVHGEVVMNTVHQEM